MTTQPASDLATQRLHHQKSIFEYLEDPKATACLPSLTCVLNDLQELMRQKNVDLDEVTKLVQIDVGMSSRVLRMANSAYYAPPEPVMDVKEAILNMGLSTFRRALLAANCIELTSHIPARILDWREFWLHAAGVGHLTMELSFRLKKPEADTESFYLMGLMHDIGKVVLAHVVPAEFERIYRQTAVEKRSPAEVELESLGIDHGQLGAWYLERQAIPVSIYEPIRFHHCLELEERPHFNHARLIKLADHLILYFLLGQSGNHAELGDPFESREWKWYLDQSRHLDADGAVVKDIVIEQVANISDLVRKIIT
jgi:HD-like signal output (HDOD) protein